MADVSNKYACDLYIYILFYVRMLYIYIIYICIKDNVCQLVEPFNAAGRVGHFVKYELTLNSKYLMTSRAGKHAGAECAQTHTHTHAYTYIYCIFANYRNKSFV